jgi:hypothetical protein
MYFLKNLFLKPSKFSHAWFWYGIFAEFVYLMFELSEILLYQHFDITCRISVQGEYYCVGGITAQIYYWLGKLAPYATYALFAVMLFQIIKSLLRIFFGKTKVNLRGISISLALIVAFVAIHIINFFIQSIFMSRSVLLDVPNIQLI